MGAQQSAGPAPLVVAILLPKDAPASLISVLPRSDRRARIQVIHSDADIATVDVSAVTAIVWVPPAPEARLKALYDRVANQVRWIHSLSAGVDGISDFISTRLATSPIPLTNGRGAFSSSLAEYAIAACLHFNKQFSRCERNRVSKQWDKFTMGTLRGKTLGFVGFGDIAKATAALAAPFGLRLIALRRSPGKTSAEPGAPQLARTYGAKESAAFYRECDFIVCSLPLTEETQKSVGKAAFAAMKPSAVFVSLGRGAVIDEAALHDALTTGKIAGAACDVFATEPLPTESPLWGCSKLLVTAHNADLTDDYFELAFRTWGDNLDCLLAGAPAHKMATPVDKQLGY